MRPIALLLLAFAWHGACRRSRGYHEGEAVMPAKAATAQDTAAEGVVRIVGADPFAQVVLSGPPGATVPDVAVAGPLGTEVAALAGLAARVRGRVVPGPQGMPPRAIEVTSYELLPINGKPPYVGKLVLQDGELWLGGKRLVGAPDELRQATGAKVWVVGRSVDANLEVELYGIITRPAR